MTGTPPQPAHATHREKSRFAAPSKTRRSILDSALFCAFLILLVWVPIPLGSNRPWAWALLHVWVSTIMLLWLWGYLTGRTHSTIGARSAAAPLAILGLWQVFLILQVTPLPASLVQILSPQAAALQVVAAPAHAWITLSVDSYATTLFCLKTFAYIEIFLLTFLLTHNSKRLRWLAYAIVISGLLQATFGSIMTLSGLEYGFMQKKEAYLGVATGTFVNRNHLAGYLEMCLAVGIGLLIGSMRSERTMEWRQKLRSLAKLIFSAKARLRMFLVMMVIGLVLTHSRMGNTAFFMSLLIAGVIGLTLFRHAARSVTILLASLIVIDLLIVSTWFGVEKVVERIGQTSISGETRTPLNHLVLAQWRDYALTGSGGGTFYTVFPQYRQDSIEAFFDHAHNDYFELAADTGIIGVTLLGLLVAMSLQTAIKAQYRRRNPLMRGMAFAATMGISAILIHSTVDFNLQIPANAATFMVLMALPWLALTIDKGKGDRR